MVRERTRRESTAAAGTARGTRAALIDAAADAFVEHGYGAMSVRDLARRLDMTTGAIYGHFRNKASLLGEAVRSRIVHDLEEHGGRRYSETALPDYVAHSFREYRKRRALRALLVEGAAAARVDDDVRQLLHDVVMEQQSRWAKLYRDAWVDERLDPDVDPAGVMLFLWAAEVGLGVLEAFDVELPKPGVLSTIVARMVGSLSGRTTTARRR
jgi:TetR/AcrR family transcriptional regulator, transcriptional repressor for nem operon